MQTTVRSDRHIPVNAALATHVEQTLRTALRHFGRRTVRVDVHFSDENGAHKTSGDDTRCVIQARLAGLKPVAVANNGSSVTHALRGAVDKLDRKLKRIIGRRRAPKRRRLVAAA